MTEWLPFHFSLWCIGEGNGNPLQCSCLENPRDGGAWWAAVCGVTQSQTWLKRLSSSSSMLPHLLFLPSHFLSFVPFFFYLLDIFWVLLIYNWQNCKIFKVYNVIWYLYALWMHDSPHQVWYIHYLTYLHLCVCVSVCVCVCVWECLTSVLLANLIYIIPHFQL